MAKCKNKNCNKDAISQGFCSPKCKIEYIKLKPKKNKYNAIKQSYGGYNYDSRKEAEYAAKLDLLIKAKEIKGYTRQHRIDIVVNGIRVAMYKIDFRIELNDGSYEYHEVKGFETDVWRLKWKIVNALYPDMKFVLIK